MAKCKKCGKELAANEKFCPNCGTPAGNDQTQPHGEKAGIQNGKNILPIAAAAVVVLVILIAVLIPKNAKINPAEYVKVVSKGLNGEGTAEFSFDAESFIETLQEEKNLKPGKVSELRGVLSNAEQYFKLSKTEGLSNGDSIEIQCSMPKKYLSDYHATVDAKSLSYTVAGLIEKQTIDVSAYYQIEFTGFEENGYANGYLDYNALYEDVATIIRVLDNSKDAENYISDELWSDLRFLVPQVDVQPLEGLSNGEKVVVNSAVDSEQRIEAYGISFESAELEYEVEGLAENETIALSDYLVGTFAGYNGYGRLRTISLDQEKMAEDFSEKFGDDRNGYTAEEAAESVVSYVKRNYSLEAESWDGFSNGDEVKIYAEADEEINYIPYLGIQLSELEKTVTAQDLVEVEYISLIEYINGTFQGYQGAGELELTIDLEGMQRDFAERFGDGRGEYSAEELVELIRSQIVYYYSVSAERTDGFSNDEEVRISVEPLEGTETYIDYVGLELAGGEKTLTAAGIQEPQEVDLNDLLTITFTGICPKVQVSAEVDKESPIYPYLEYDSIREIPENLQAVNGDTLEVTLRWDAEAALKGGYTAGTTSKTYTISGLPTYDYTLESVDVPVFSAAIENSLNELEAKLLEKNGDDFAKEMGYPGGKIVWSQMKSSVVRIEKYYTDQARHANHTAIIYELRLPVIAVDHSQHTVSKFAISWYTDIYEEPNGSLVLGEERRDSFFNDLDTAAEEAAGAEEYLEVSEGGQVIKTVVTNENLENELSIEAITEVKAAAAEEIPDTGLEKCSLLESGTILHLSNGDLDEESTVNTYGVEVKNPIILDASNESWMELHLNGEYAFFSGEISVHENADTEVSADLAVFGDNKLLYAEYAIGRQTEPHRFTIDVSDVTTLVVAARNTGAYSYGLLLLGETKLARAEKPSYKRNTALLDLGMIENQTDSTWKTLYQDADGEMHPGGIRFLANEQQFAVWNLGGGYTEFQGILTSGYYTSETSHIQVKIYGDNELLYSISDFGKASPLEAFTIDVTDVEVLKIATEDEGYGHAVYLTGATLAAKDAEVPAEAEVPEELELPEINSRIERVASAAADYGDHKYYLIESATTWEEAKKRCEQIGGSLAAITSPLEQSRIRLLLENAEGYGYWLGGTDENREGVWTWTTGEAFEFMNWQNGQPDNYDHGDRYENYLEIYTNGTWNDCDEAEELGFILEVSADAESVTNHVELAAVSYSDPDSQFENVEYFDRAVGTQDKEYISGYRLYSSSNGWIHFDLNGEYSSLSAILSPTDDCSESAAMNIGFFGEGRLLYGKYGIAGWSSAQNIEIDVTGVQRLSIRTNNRGNYGELLLTDATLKKADEAAEIQAVTRLRELQLVDSSSLDISEKLCESSRQELFDGVHKIDASQQGYVVYLLGGNYTQFSGSIAASPDMNYNQVITVEIYGDGTLLEKIEGVTKEQAKQSFDVDVTGVKNLEIKTSAEEGRNGYVLLAEDVLK